MRDCIRQMIFDLVQYKEKSYDVKNNKICYDRDHSVSYKERHGYMTMWHAFHAKLPEDKLNQYIAINVQGSRLSYTHMVNEYSLVLAITGTLKAMHSKELNFIEDKLRSNGKEVYKTFLPSAFLKDDVKITTTKVQLTNGIEEHHKAIADYIIEVGSEKVPDLEIKRPICVLFRLVRDLEEFQKYSGYAAIKELYNTHTLTNLTGGSKDLEKEINRIPSPNTLTLMTEPFSRGIDPKTADDRVIKLNGVLLIQTYVSQSQADEEQAIGRVGRHGEPGSWACIYDLNSPAKGGEFKLSDEQEKELRNVDDTDPKNYQETVLKLIRDYRKEYYGKRYDDVLPNSELLKSSNEESKDFLKNLCNVESDDCFEKVQKYLLNMNECTIKNSDQNPFRLLICIDATATMHNSITIVRKSIKNMIATASGILEYLGVNRGFQIKILGYRNYDVDYEHLISHTEWTEACDYKKLEDFLTNMIPKSGPKKHFRLRNGEEAIEVALAYANEEVSNDRCNTVIVMGDEKALSSDQITRLRQVKGEDYWQSFSLVAKPTELRSEVKKLAVSNIPVHAYYLKDKARNSFINEIANPTGGKHCKFDHSKSDSNELQLIKEMSITFCENILRGMDKTDVFKSYCGASYTAREGCK